MSDRVNDLGIDKLLTREEAADVLKKRPSWLKWAERQKLIPYVKVGQQIRYRASDLKEWIDGQVVRALRDRIDAVRDQRGL